MTASGNSCYLSRVNNDIIMAAIEVLLISDGIEGGCERGYGVGGRGLPPGYSEVGHVDHERVRRPQYHHNVRERGIPSESIYLSSTLCGGMVFVGLKGGLAFHNPLVYDWALCNMAGACLGSINTGI